MRNWFRVVVALDPMRDKSSLHAVDRDGALGFNSGTNSVKLRRTKLGYHEDSLCVLGTTANQCAIIERPARLPLLDDLVGHAFGFFR